MDQKLLRNVGITVGAAALAGALGIATMTGDPAPSSVQEQPTMAGPVEATPPEPNISDPASAEEAPVFEAADAAAPPSAAELSFLVRFRGNGPIARAQALAAQGREADGARAAQAALSRQAALRGLCFDRFTVGAAEMVLRPCVAIPAAEHAQYRDRWLPRLRAMPGVAYAEVNAIAAPDRTP